MPKMSQLMRLWYLSHRQPAKAQASLRSRAVSPEPSLFAHMKNGNRRRVRLNIRRLAQLDVCPCAYEECSRRAKSVIIYWDGSNESWISAISSHSFVRLIATVFCFTVITIYNFLAPEIEQNGSRNRLNEENVWYLVICVWRFQTCFSRIRYQHSRIQ